ncbi:MAG: SdrD B-like domain-containing protein [Pirellulales bacterium]
MDRFEQLEDRRVPAGVLTPQEQLLIELVNRARANPTAEAARYGISLNQDLDPGTISADPKMPLAPNQILAAAATGHAQDMLNRQFFEHVNPDGKNPSDRAIALGYPTGAGENIAWYGYSTGIDRIGEVYARHEALFLSKGHRVNMLTTHYREIGTSVRYGTFENLPAIMVAEEFGNRGGNIFLTGVAYTDQLINDNFYTATEGLGNITITATSDQTGTVYTTVTEPAGGYAMQLPNGTYHVQASGTGLPFTADYSHVVVYGINFKLDFNARQMTPGIIHGLVYRDANKSNGLDGGDQRLAGATVYLDIDRDGIQDAAEPTAVTDSEGVYRFLGLAPGRYTIGVAPGSGLDSTLTAVTDPITVTAGVTSNGPNFGLVQGFPWHNKTNPFDVNGDGKTSPGDAVSLMLDINVNRVRLLAAPVNGVSTPPPYVDVNADGYVSPRDILAVIQELNRINRAGQQATTMAAGRADATSDPGPVAATTSLASESSTSSATVSALAASSVTVSPLKAMAADMAFALSPLPTARRATMD